MYDNKLYRRKMQGKKIRNLHRTKCIRGCTFYVLVFLQGFVHFYTVLFRHFLQVCACFHRKWGAYIGTFREKVGSSKPTFMVEFFVRSTVLWYFYPCPRRMQVGRHEMQKSIKCTLKKYEIYTITVYKPLKNNKIYTIAA